MRQHARFLVLLLSLAASAPGAQEASGFLLDSATVRASSARTLSELLAGRVPGIAVASPSGARGIAPQLRMRGVSGLIGAAEPMLYMDGMLVRDDEYWLGVEPEGHRPSFAWDLPVDEIESVRIVRGQSEGALMEFGAPRGAVFVTTRRPTAGQSLVSGFMEGRTSSERTGFPANHGMAGVDSAGPTNACTLSRQALGECTATQRLTRNPLEEASPFKRTVSWRAGVSATGAVASGAYRATAILDRDLGILAPSRADRLDLSASFRNALGARVALAIEARHVNSTATFTRWDDILAAGMLGAPTGAAAEAYIPAIADLRRAVLPMHRDRTTLGATARWTVREGISASARVGIDRALRHGATHEEFPDPLGAGTIIIDRHDGSRLLTWSADGGVRAIHRIAGVRLALDARVFASHTAFDDSALVRLENGDRVASQSFMLSPSLRSIGAVVGQRFTFGARAQRTIGAGVRASSVNFEEDVRVGLAHQLDASWDVAEEAFFARPTWLDRLRLTASHGAGSDLAPVLGLMSRSTAFLPGGSFDPSERAPRIAETALGMHTIFLFGALTADVNAFRRVASEVPLPVPLPDILGFRSAVHGGNEVEVRGEEFHLAITNRRIGPVRVNAATSLSTARERVTHLAVPDFGIGTGSTGPLMIVREGSALGERRGWDLSWNDANGDGIIDRTEVSAAVSATRTAGTRPTRLIAASGDVSWRGLRLGAVLDAQRGHRRYDEEFDRRCRASLCEELYDPATPLATQARAVAARYNVGPAGPLQDAGFVRLREVWLRLEIPARWVPGAVGGARVTLSGHQLAVWSAYEGLDPEVGAFIGPSTQTSARFNQPLVPAWSLRIDLGR